MATNSTPARKRPAKRVSDLGASKPNRPKVMDTSSSTAVVSSVSEPTTSPTASSLSSKPTTSGSPIKSKLAVPPHLRPLAWRIGLAVVALIIVFVGIFGVLVYRYQSDSSVVRSVTEVIHYPVERVNGSYVSYEEYLFQLNTYKSYLSSKNNSSGQTPVNFNSTAGKAQLKQVKQQVMTMLKTNEVVRQLAAQHKVSITSKDVTTEVKALATQAGGDAKLRQVLASVYGWNENDLRHQLSFQLLEQKLQTNLASNPTLNTQAKATATKVLAQIKAGGDFATLAKKYSQDSATAANGGELGTISKTSGLDPAFTTAAFALTAGQVSGLVKTSNGYEIIKVNSVNGAQLDASHILIEPIDFQQYLTGQVQKAKSTTYLKV